jgi:uncharacterized membrane protein YedE/YeeE
MSRRVAGAIVGIFFGVVLSWTGMVSPDVIRGALLFEESYLFLFFGSAVATAFVGLRLIRGRTALLSGEPIEWVNERPQRRHVVGSLVFGAGWGIAHACPGPVAAQVGQGVWWAFFTLAGVVLGVYFFLRHQEETEPAAERAEAHAAPARA